MAMIVAQRRRLGAIQTDVFGSFQRNLPKIRIPPIPQIHKIIFLFSNLMMRAFHPCQYPAILFQLFDELFAVHGGYLCPLSIVRET